MAPSRTIAWSETAFSDDEDKPEAKIYKTNQARQSTASLHSIRTYNEVEMVTFILSDTNGERTWDVHSSILEPQSALFKRVIEYGRCNDSSEPDPCQRLRGLERSAPATNTFFLSGMNEGRFQAFVQAVKPTLGRGFTAQELIDILVVATDWGFRDLRSFVMEQILECEIPPMVMIGLCRRIRVSEWLLKPYTELAIRLAPLDRFEVKALGPSAVAAISMARERVVHRRLNLVRSDTPPSWMGSSFWHQRCWDLLSASWSSVLTNPQYAGMNPRQALNQKMKALQGKKVTSRSGRQDSHSICSYCLVPRKIESWLNLTQDVENSTKILKEALGGNVDLWLLHSEDV